MNPTEKEIDEAFPNRLVRVVRKLKRQLGDGSSKEYEQTFHVKRASPGDRYAQRRARANTSGTPMPQVDFSSDPQPAAAPTDSNKVPSEQPESDAPQNRVVVKPHDLPWEIGTNQGGLGNEDPIPPEIRSRFDPKNRALRVTNPVINSAPANVVTPGEQMLWGVVEQELLDRLRSGTLTRYKSSGTENGVMLVKVEGSDGYVHHAYIKIEGLADPFTYAMWGELYDLDRDRGDLSRRAAAAYEVAKAAGFDDLVPPTVVRRDEHGDLDPMLTPELIERRQNHSESLIRATGDDEAGVRKRLSGYSSLQLHVPDSHSVAGEKWFRDVFADDNTEPTDALNRFYEVIPPDRRMGFVRAALLDFLLWTGERSLTNVGFGTEPWQSLLLLDNEIRLPNPAVLGREWEKYGGSYNDPPQRPDARPLLWSDIVRLLSVRGKDKDLLMYEEIAAKTARRLKEERTPEVVRSLLEHQVHPLAVAGFLSRLGMVSTHAQMVARDPFVALHYWAQCSGNTEPDELLHEFDYVEQYVNDGMSRGLGRDFDFLDEMASYGEGDEDASDE